jgi:hypothetical protein
MSITVYDPTSGSVAEKMHLASRPSSLLRSVAGVIDNGKLRSDIVLNRIVENLKSRFGISDIVSFRKPAASQGIEKEAAQRLAEQCDFVLAGVGD